MLISSLGSGGDIHPFLAVGAILRSRGHEVVFLTNPHFRSRVLAAGLHFEPLGTEEEYFEILRHPDLVHPRRGPRFVVREIVQNVTPETYAAARRLVREMKADLVLRHHLSFGAGWAAEKEGVRDAVAVLAPLLWLSTADPSVFGFWKWRPPRMLARLRMAISTRAGRTILDRPLNEVRRQLNLPAQRDMFALHCRGGDVNLGLWSKHFRSPAADDPARGRICGFSTFDRHPDDESAGGELTEFLSRGPAPVVFTLGTSVVHHAGDFYGTAARVCGRLGRRAVLVGAPADLSPSRLGRDVLPIRYAPFSTLLSAGAATVHHGGVGSTGAALAAGKPTVIVPFANDEFDNAARAERLGASRTLFATRLSERSLELALRAVLEDPACVDRAAHIARLMKAEDGARTAANILEGEPAGTRAARA